MNILSSRLRPGLVALALLLALGAGASAPAADGGKAARVDLNAASAEQLEALPGIGASKAAAIVAARTERGGFGSVEELAEVRGIGDTLLERLRPMVRVGPRPGARARPGGTAKR